MGIGSGWWWVRNANEYYLFHSPGFHLNLGKRDEFLLISTSSPGADCVTSQIPPHRESTSIEHDLNPALRPGLGHAQLVIRSVSVKLNNKISG